MSQITCEGTFRGYIVENGLVQSSKSKAMQFVARFQATQIYNEDAEEWQDCSHWDETEITGYFCISDKSENPIKFQAEALNRALGWSGDVSELDGDFSDTIVQFRVQEETYEGKTNLKVVRIDHADADPTRSLQKLDSAQVKTVAAKMNKKFQNLFGGPKPKSVGKPETPAAEKKTTKKSSKKKPPRKADNKSKEKDAPKKGEPVGVETLDLPETATEDEAWEQVETHIVDGVTDDQVTEVWISTVEDMGGAGELDKDGGWARVRDIVLETLGTK